MEKSAEKRTKPAKRTGRSPVIAVRVPESLHQRIKDEASSSGRSMSEEMAWLLGRAFEWQDTFGEAQEMLAEARQATTEALRARMHREGWTSVTGVGGTVWFEPGVEANQWFVSNTPQAVVEDIAERAAIRAIQKVTAK